MNDDQEVNEILRLAISADEDALLIEMAELFEQEDVQAAMAAGISPRDLLDTGKQFFIGKVIPAARFTICDVGRYCELRGSAIPDIARFVADQVLAALLEIGGIPEALAHPGSRFIRVVTAAILKRGLDPLCDCAA